MQGYSLELVTPAAVEPVDLETVKLHCRVGHDGDDALFTSWLTAARELIEEEASVRLVNSTWRMSLHDWPCEGVIEFPIGPVQSVSSLKYLAINGTLTTLVADTDYLTALGRRPPIVYPAPLAYWPGLASGRLDAVRVEFVAGFGAAASDVPEKAKAAILLTVGYWDANRGDAEDATKLGLPPGALRLIRNLNTGGYR